VRRAAGRRARPRGSHAAWEPPDPDAAAILSAQDPARLPQYVSIRYGRMSTSSFAFFRGAAVVMAADLAGSPVSGMTVQLHGDAHLVNFGLYASPERTLLFDINDVDETLPGPWEWDVKRLAASAVIAGRANGFDAGACRRAALAAVRSCRECMGRYAAMGDLAVWYSRIAAEDALAIARRTKGIRVKATERGVTKARTRDNLQALAKLTAVVDGRLRIVDDPPLVSAP